jgi:two-component system, cell cycle sensor histidine kinase and response regulator CckA
MHRRRFGQEPVAGGRPRSVLIVDDIAMVRRSIAVLLSAAGFRVFEASDGAEALEVLKAASAMARLHEQGHGGAIDLVLTDVMMPFGGVALVQEIRARWPEQRVLYMSGFPAATLRAEGLGALDGPFLAKPFNAEELMEKVWEALQTRPADTGRHPASAPAPKQKAADQRQSAPIAPPAPPAAPEDEA